MKPNLIIIGAQKCGSSSLHQYLDHHPQVSMSSIKELDYFVDTLNWNNGPEWYESQFSGPTRVHGESSPSYTMFPNFSGVPERMHDYLPDAKLIYIVRDPIDRIVSHFLHQWYKKRQDTRSIENLADLGDARSKHYICTSSYHLQLSQYIEYYDISRILVVSLESLKKDRQSTLRQVFRFLEVDESFELPAQTGIANATSSKVRKNRAGEILLSRSPLASAARNIGGKLIPGSAKDWIRARLGEKHKPPELTTATRDALVRALEDDIRQFRELTGQAFEEWSL